MLGGGEARASEPDSCSEPGMGADQAVHSLIPFDLRNRQLKGGSFRIPREIQIMVAKHLFSPVLIRFW